MGLGPIFFLPPLAAYKPEAANDHLFHNPCSPRLPPFSLPQLACLKLSHSSPSSL